MPFLTCDENGIHNAELWCDCHDFDHIARFMWLDSDKEEDFPILFHTVSLRTGLPWWKRIWEAVKYVFNRTSVYGDFCELVLTVDDARKLSAWLDEFVKVMGIDSVAKS